MEGGNEKMSSPRTGTRPIAATFDGSDSIEVCSPGPADQNQNLEDINKETNMAAKKSTKTKSLKKKVMLKPVKPLRSDGGGATVGR